MLLVGPPVEALREWLQRADITQGADLPGHRPLGGGRGEGADAAVDQPDRQAALRDGRAGGEGVFRARVEIGVSDGGGATGRALPEAMHQSVQQAASYYNEAERLRRFDWLFDV